ncbi:hypothetical protein ACB092_08G002500 [Castanea dentata]
MEASREVLDECEFKDLGYVGGKYTWYRGSRGGNTIWERLDRAAATTDWIEKFPATKVVHLECVNKGKEDEWRFTKFYGEPDTSNRHESWEKSRRLKNRFTLPWLCAGDFNEILKADEKLGGRFRPIRQMEASREVLDECEFKDLGYVGGKYTWYRGSRGGNTIWERLDRAAATTDWIEKFPATKVVHLECGSLDHKPIIILPKGINGLLIKEEKMWKQRSRELWPQEGDQNTKFFQYRACHRYKRNRIKELKNEAGMACTDEEEIAKILIEYYQNLFTLALASNVEEILMAVPIVIIDEENVMLVIEFVKAKVEEALQQMALLKAPGPDGLTPLFYQNFWPSIGEDVSKAILNCLNSGSIPSSINHTFITLIPKVKSPSVVSEFCPIALCNVIYKLLSKVVTNRLKKVLPYIISESQSAFQSNKAILENILVAFELLHHMKTQKSKKAVNEEPKGEIFPSRGIHQGDPLLPYLFLSCSEGLNRMIQKAAREDIIRGFSLCKNGPKITHLFFADDSLLFCRWKEKLLSQAGREVLLKAVVQAIPTFAMSCFKLSVGLCKEIEMQIRKFCWEILCKSKFEGGMGFKDLVRFNEAMLAKQIWRLQTQKDSLLYKVFNTKYFPSGSMFEASCSTGSFAWQSLLKARHVIEKGMMWRVGDGTQIRVFHEKWIPGPIRLCRSMMRDCIVWLRTRDRNYSVKTGYQLLGELENKEIALVSNNNNLRSFWKGIWKMRIPNKIKNFCWRAYTQSLPTLANLHQRKVITSPLCSNCGKSSKTTLHALWECDKI